MESHIHQLNTIGGTLANTNVSVSAVKSQIQQITTYIKAMATELENLQSWVNMMNIFQFVEMGVGIVGMFKAGFASMEGLESLKYIEWADKDAELAKLKNLTVSKVGLDADGVRLNAARIAGITQPSFYSGTIRGDNGAVMGITDGTETYTTLGSVKMEAGNSARLALQDGSTFGQEGLVPTGDLRFDVRLQPRDMPKQYVLNMCDFTAEHGPAGLDSIVDALGKFRCMPERMKTLLREAITGDESVWGALTEVEKQKMVGFSSVMDRLGASVSIDVVQYNGEVLTAATKTTPGKVIVEGPEAKIVLRSDPEPENPPTTTDPEPENPFGPEPEPVFVPPTVEPVAEPPEYVFPQTTWWDKAADGEPELPASVNPKRQLSLDPDEVIFSDNVGRESKMTPSRSVFSRGPEKVSVGSDTGVVVTEVPSLPADGEVAFPPPPEFDPLPEGGLHQTKIDFKATTTKSSTYPTTAMSETEFQTALHDMEIPQSQIDRLVQTIDPTDRVQFISTSSAMKTRMTSVLPGEMKSLEFRAGGISGEIRTRGLPEGRRDFDVQAMDPLTIRWNKAEIMERMDMDSAEFDNRLTEQRKMPQDWNQDTLKDIPIEKIKFNKEEIKEHTGWNDEIFDQYVQDRTESSDPGFAQRHWYENNLDSCLYEEQGGYALYRAKSSARQTELTSILEELK